MNEIFFIYLENVPMRVFIEISSTIPLIVKVNNIFSSTLNVLNT